MLEVLNRPLDTIDRHGLDWNWRFLLKMWGSSALDPDRRAVLEFRALHYGNTLLKSRPAV